MRIFPTFFQAPIIVVANAVQEKLGVNFYAFSDAYPVVLEDGLFVQVGVQLDFADDLAATGYERGFHYGVGYPGIPEFVRCAGVVYDLGPDMSVRSAEPWTQDSLPEAVRVEHQNLQLTRRLSDKRVEQARLDAACDVAVAERIPIGIVTWARKQPSALQEMRELRESVFRLRAAGCPEEKVAAALASEYFLQALFTLKQETQIQERALRWP